MSVLLRFLSCRLGRCLPGLMGICALAALPARGEELVNPFGEEAATTVVAGGDVDLDALQFSGVASILDQRSFNFTDSRTRKNFWVAMNGSENGFSIESYDEQAEQVVVRRGSRTRGISMRKTVLVALPAPPPRPYAAAPGPQVATAAAARPPGSGVDEIKNPKTPEEIKQAEYEARMLVSDLLDISMQERARQKALREAQARGQPAPSAPAGSARR